MMDYKRLLKYAMPYKGRFVLAMIAMGIYSAVAGLLVYLSKQIMDGVFINEDPAVAKYNLICLCLVMPLIYVIKGVADYGRCYFLNYVSQNAIKDLRQDLCYKLISLSHSFYVKNTSSKIMSRLTNDINALQDALVKVPPTLLRDSLIIIGMIGGLFYLHWKYAFFIVVVLPILGIPLAQFARKLKKASKDSMVQISEIYTSLQEILSGFSVIKSFCREKHEEKRFAVNNKEYYNVQQRIVRVDARTTPVMEFLSMTGVAVVLWFGGKDVINGVWTLGDFTAFILAITQMYQPIKNFAQLNSTIQKAASGSERVFEILDEKVEIFDSPDAKTLDAFSKNIVYKNVSFKYEQDKPILNNINIDIEKGQTIAFVGSSGSGKSTIANLILRFYDVNSGEILVDGTNIKNLTLESLRDKIGVVSQDVFLFNDTIRYNIAYGKLDATDEEIEAAAKAANAHKFISKMPEGYSTLIGERGMKLSGGEKQRIAIARAMLKNPPILILDEATSALDSESEKLVQEAIETLMKNRTVILIAHRLSTVKNADKIIVIDKGTIAETGKHQELLDKDGIYAKLYNLK
ncbi:MAG: ABC transporter ATP-binding protein [Elusimicrobia bacterium]|nr:ABC transporter ATP-binding protein [Elusimicrobiota bacterium]